MSLTFLCLMLGAVFAGPKRQDEQSDLPPPQVQVRQSQVDQYFHHKAADWKALYEEQEQGLNGRIYGDRKALTLAWIDQLQLSPGARILETGCGAGFLSVALAQRGFELDALDTVETMLNMTRANALSANVQEHVHPTLGDVHNLTYPAETFDAVLALGVLPWLHSPQLALAEMTRVLKPGGYLLVTVDNLWRLHYILDPRNSPVFGALRRAASHLRRRWKKFRNQPVRQQLIRYDTIAKVDASIAAVNLTKIKGVTLGFGPFSFFGIPVLTDKAGVWLHDFLQKLAKRDTPVLRSTGAHYILLARK